MNKEQLQQKVANMEAELAEMKALLNKPEPTINYWQPKHCEPYYFVNEYGVVASEYFSTYSQNRSSIYNRLFKTKAEAKKYADYIKAEETLRKAIAEANRGWLPNWSNSDEYKYFIHLKTNESTLYVSWIKTLKASPNFMYIKYSSDAMKIIKDYEQELITYLSY